MNRELKSAGVTPITTSIIESFYPNLKSADKKVAWLEKGKYIIRLKRGLYVVNPEYSGKTFSSELIANHIYTPSYVSMSSALRYYGLIPESVYIHQSMTLKHSREFNTPLGVFDYKYIAREAFSLGVKSVNRGDYAFLIASPEKALCDLVANTSNLNLRYLKDVEIYLEQDIRMDIEEFYKFDTSILEEYLRVGKKAESIATILKYLRR